MIHIIPVLYVKTGCPWCDSVMEYLKNQNIKYEKITVTGDQEAFEEMRQLSGQTKAPVMDWDGEILADFGVEELVDFLKERDINIS
ncbi:MAG: glutaredoxin family protein [Verrucomicrobiota bacterium]